MGKPHEGRTDFQSVLQGLYPFTSHFLDVAGGRLHYLDEGQGEPVVMLHGNPTWSFYYRSLILALRGSYRAIVPDHIGCGLSDKPDDRAYEYTLARRAADLETLLDHLGIQNNLTLVLHDWGGMIGMAYADRHPERIKRLVILNTGAFRLPPGKSLPWSIWLGRNTWLGKWLIRGANAFSRGALRYCVTRPLPLEVQQAYLAPYDSWANRIAVLRFVEDIPLRPGDPSYDLVVQIEMGLLRFRDVPMLICWGERDFVFDHHFLAEWQKFFPEAEVHRFPDAGHYVLEDAGEAIVPLVRDFLDRHPLTTSGSPLPGERGVGGEGVPFSPRPRTRGRGVGGEGASFSPRPRTRGRGVGGEGVEPHRNREGLSSCGVPLLTPNPSPPVRGRGGETASQSIPSQHGGEGRKTVNIADHLPAMAQTHPSTLAIVQPRGWTFRYRHYTFLELYREAGDLAVGLHALGIRRGMRTVLMVPPSLDFYALTFALFRLGAVVVMIDPGMGIKNLGVCLEEAKPQAFIGIPRAHLARVLLGWAKHTLLLHVTVGPRFGWGGVTLHQIRHRGNQSQKNKEWLGAAGTHADELAAILFTSGSTGVAKGVMYTHGIFAAQVEMLRRIYGIQPGEVDLPTFPLFGLFGPALGITVIIPRMDPTRPARVDPEWIVNAIKHFRVTNLFGSPALIERVGRYGSAQEVILPSLRRVISAGAPVPVRAIERFADMLYRKAQVHTPYGATESLPVASIGSHEILGETSEQTRAGKGVCVGRPVEGMTVRILRITDEAIPLWSDDLVLSAREIGEIVVQGPVVTRAYFNRPDSTRLAKIDDQATGTFWHRMGDVGYLDEHGRLWFCGRKSQRVVTVQGTMFTISCEGVFNAHPAVLRTALVGVTRNAERKAVLIVEIDRASGRRGDNSLKRELLELGARHEHTRAIQTILFHHAFPVDIRHNAKIFREKLAEWAARQLP